MANARYTDLQLDALRELANIGSGTAGTALSSLLGSTIELSVPSASALELADAVEAAGEPDDLVWGVVVPVSGQVDATALLVIGEDDARTLCALLGVEADTETGRSALGEIGNIMVSSYVGALATMTGFELDLRPPESTRDMLAPSWPASWLPTATPTRWRSCSTPSSRSPATPAPCPSCCCRRPRASPSCCTGSASVTDLSTATATHVVVRMGELAASASPEDVLVCVGLGSCIGLALVCRYGRACGLAHIVLPESGGREAERPAKYAEHGVPALVAALGALGVAPTRSTPCSSAARRCSA